MKFEYNGKIYNQKQLAEMVGRTSSWVSKKLGEVKSIEELVELSKTGVSRNPKNKYISCQKIVEYKGKKYNIKELAELSGLNYHTISARIRYGWTVEEAVEIPVLKSGWKVREKYKRGHNE